MPRCWWVLIALATLLPAVTPDASGHPPIPTVAVVKVGPDGLVTITVIHDVLAFALDDTSQNIPDPPMYELLHSPDDVLGESLSDSRDRFMTQFRLSADGRPVEIEIAGFPTVAALRAWQLEHPDRRLPVKMDIVAHATLPMGTRSVSVRLPQVFGDVIVTIDRPGVEPVTLPLRPGETSPQFALTGGDGPRPEGDTPPVSWWEVFRRYVVLGFTHIIPEGADHALFVLGLFLLSPRFKTVLWQITAFTIAHSITLFLTTFRVITISPSVIEPTIAASIAFIAIENIFTTKVHSWRVVVAFVFGLVHGMGFATALAQVGLPTGQLVAGVIAFNIGVECGHLVVLAAAILAIGWWRDKPWYRKRLTIPLSVVIAVIALFWMVQRTMGPP